MSKVLKSVLTLALIFGFTLTTALAGTQDRDRLRSDPDQKRDRSCQQDVIKAFPTLDLSANQNRTQKRNGDPNGDGNQDRKRDQDRLNDGSCNSASLENLTGIYLAAGKTKSKNQDRTRDEEKLNERSCQD
jgi:hypothetical protein